MNFDLMMLPLLQNAEVFVFVCVIPKLFPYDKFCEVMKLTRAKLVETIRAKNNGMTTYQARKIAGISIRRVNQLYTQYLGTGEIPELKMAGRKPKPILPQERELVAKTYATYRVSASTLEPIIARDYGIHMPHNRIHRIMRELGYAKPIGYTPRKTDWIRYERRHSLTAVHVDWHQRPMDGPWVFAVEDDASRALLALIECSSPTTETSIQGMLLALQHGEIRQCISDHGAQFTSNNDGNSLFQEFLGQKGIKPILCRIKHPQSNGKVEKWFDTYERHRDAFQSKEEFLHWYNVIRPHRSLRFEALETPWQAFERKRRI